jgi:hypothetical protein
MVIANQINLQTRESLVIETTEDFSQDLNKLTELQKQEIDSKLQAISLAIEDNNNASLFNYLQKVTAISLSEYTSSLHILKVNHNLRIFLFYEDDPLFNRQIITLLRVCLYQDMNKVLKDLCQSFYQEKLNYLGEIDDER